jgi:hypothetical protein
MSQENPALQGWLDDSSVEGARYRLRRGHEHLFKHRNKRFVTTTLNNLKHFEPNYEFTTGVSTVGEHYIHAVGVGKGLFNGYTGDPIKERVVKLQPGSVSGVRLEDYGVPKIYTAGVPQDEWLISGIGSEWTGG